MSLKTLIAGVAAVVILAGTALVPTGALAQRGGHGGHPGGGGGGFHPGGGGFHYGGGFRGFRGGYGGGIGVYPWWGYGFYPAPYYYGPSCGYVRVRYFRHRRVHWRLVYRCY
jgi:hypothetical protein